MPFRWSNLTDFLFFCGQHDKEMCAKARYRCLHRSLLIIMMLITMIPLTITAGISFYQYQHLLQEETSNNARWSTETASKSIETYIQKLQAAILLLADVYTFDTLADQNKLNEVFAKLKSEYPGVVDLSIIAQDGIQRSYAGPYNLIGKSYSDSPWYTKALAQKIYVSEAFMGFRNLPHFVIAISKKEPKADGYWVLRASIDCNTLDQFLTSIIPETADDIFLINNDGILQSTSRHYGKISDQLALPEQPKKSGVFLSEAVRNKLPVLRAVGYIKDTPWILILEQQGYIHQKNWLSFKNQLMTIYAACLMVAGLSVIRIATFLARRIRDADETRDVVISQTEHTNKLASIGRLAAGVAHEINNPLAIINEKAGLMQDLLAMSPDFQYREKFLLQLDKLQEAVKRSRTITHRLLGFSRRMDITLEPIKLNEVIAEVMGFLENDALYRNIVFSLDFPKELPTIHSDRGQLQQIFLNIINNAIDAVNQDGEIGIKIVPTQQLGMQVEIADNGPGIPPEVLQNIFEPFFTTKTGPDKQGTGLGLFITYGLVKKLGGQIVAHSTVNQGTTFALTFPSTVAERGCPR